MLVLKDAGNMPRRNASDASGRHPQPNVPQEGQAPRPLPPSLRVVTQQKNIPKFFAIGRDVTSPCGNLRVRLPRTVATPAARP